LIQSIYGTNKKEILDVIEKEEKILQIKNKIYHNNLLKNKKENIPLLKELRIIYEEEKQGKRFKNKFKPISKKRFKLNVHKSINDFIEKTRNIGRTPYCQHIRQSIHSNRH
jgi:hypothetical protein